MKASLSQGTSLYKLTQSLHSCVLPPPLRPFNSLAPLIHPFCPWLLVSLHWSGSSGFPFQARNARCFQERRQSSDRWLQLRACLLMCVHTHLHMHRQMHLKWEDLQDVETKIRLPNSWKAGTVSQACLCPLRGIRWKFNACMPACMMEIMKLENKEKRVRIVISENTIKIIDLPSMRKSLSLPPFCRKRFLQAAMLGTLLYIVLKGAQM